VRLGHASLVPFQAARIGGHRPGTAVAGRPRVIPVDWPGLGRPEPPRPATRPSAEDEVTDLKVLVGQIKHAAAGLGIRTQPSPWLGPLPRTLLLRDLTAGDPTAGDLTASPGTPPGRAQISAPFGLIDLPGEQRQQPAVLHMDTFGHLMAAGAPRSGRSQLLRTIATSIAVSTSCADAHLYGIDCGNGALLPIADLPHCGAVVTRTQAERATRLITRLGAELERRQELLAAGGFADVTEQRAAAGPPDRLPRIIVLLDRWEGFTTTLGEPGSEAADVITGILAEGASAGVHLIMTGDRSLLAGDAQISRSLRPFRVDVLPARITFDDAWDLRPPGAPRPLWGLAGVGGDELAALGPDLADGTPAFIVAGPARSGRSSVLASMTRSFLAGGAQVILVTPRPSPLRSLASIPGVTGSFTGPDLGEDDLVAAIASLTAPGVVVMDDADLLTDCEAAGQLSKIITRGAGRSLALVVAGDPDTLAGGFGGWQADARRARRGCLTGPATLPEGELIGARLSHAQLSRQVKPGRALLHTGDGALTTIAVPVLGVLMVQVSVSRPAPRSGSWDAYRSSSSRCTQGSCHESPCRARRSSHPAWAGTPATGCAGPRGSRAPGRKHPGLRRGSSR